MKQSQITGKEAAQITGALTVLAATCCATPELIIKSLTGILWNEAEADDLLASLTAWSDHLTRITNDMVADSGLKSH